MLLKIVCLSLLAVVLCAAVDEPIPIVQQDSELNPDGSFQWSYQSGDGTAQQQSGQLQGAGEEVGEDVKGSVSWVDPEGNPHQVNYVANQDGYQPESADIPQAPEIPAGIQRALEWNLAHPEEDKE